MGEGRPGCLGRGQQGPQCLVTVGLPAGAPSPAPPLVGTCLCESLSAPWTLSGLTESWAFRSASLSGKHPTLLLRSLSCPLFAGDPQITPFPQSSYLEDSCSKLPTGCLPSLDPTVQLCSYFNWWDYPFIGSCQGWSLWKASLMHL